MNKQKNRIESNIKNKKIRARSLGGERMQEIYEVAKKAVEKYSKITDSETKKKAVETVARLLEGNKNFVEKSFKNVNKPLSEEEENKIKQGQWPSAVVIACSDSRVKTDRIFDTKEGDIFDIQTAGEALDKAALGSIQYGVAHTPANVIIVMGHEQCGAVTAAYNDAKEIGPLGETVEQIKKNIEGAKDLDEAIFKNTYKIVEQLKNTEGIKELYEQGKIAIIPVHYHLAKEIEII